MKTREKVLVGMMVIAVGYGAFRYLTNIPDLMSVEDTPAFRQKLATQFVTESQSKIEAVSLNSDELYAEEQIVAPWLINPFAERIAVKAAVEEVEIVPVIYSGYVDAGGRMFAMLNGQAYQIGDKLLESPYSILSINPSQVVLSVTNSNKSIIVKLKDE